jgi:hypothetical protein
MVVQEKKAKGIKICVDLRKLNDAFLHDPFPTPFTYEVFIECGRTKSVLLHRWIFRLPSDHNYCRG